MLKQWPSFDVAFCAEETIKLPQINNIQKQQIINLRDMLIILLIS
jgi:hypothetical protein